MEAIIKIVPVHNQIITLKLPLNFNAKEVEVIVLQSEIKILKKIKKQFTTIKIDKNIDYKFDRDELNQR